MSKIEPRNVTPIISAIRNFLLGREHQTPLRFETAYSPRTQPPPELPEGPAHKLYLNYYCSRDARREVAPPLAIGPSTKQISSKSASGDDLIKSKAPGKAWRWD